MALNSLVGVIAYATYRCLAFYIDAVLSISLNSLVGVIAYATRRGNCAITEQDLELSIPWLEL